MREFFHGWRRKIGVMTLVMACVVMAAWVRSIVTVDRIWFPGGTIGAGSGFVWWITMSTAREWELDSIPLGELDDSPEDWAFDEYEWEAPYWLLAIPLTLLSAYLLLSKSRVVKPPESTKPPEEAQVTHA